MNQDLVTIEELTHCDKKDAQEINTLLHAKYRNATLTIPILTTCIKRSFVFVARRNKKIIGVILLNPIFSLHETTGNISNLHTSYLFTKQSLRQLREVLIDAVIQKAQSLHLSCLTVTIEDYESEKRSLYKSKGFNLEIVSQLTLKLK